ncbi:metal-dependent hydrolase [Acinetobacter sp. CFCC 10889]|uniref:metal-dependent hydrolase n=1 Tax=Acinetobacter sp. CFCC 10889 TaxID=1775557 RepID=UPI000DCF664D|nr:metal-dependent hydrolase [Acinetobacter sp. CFCC 10889]
MNASLKVQHVKHQVDPVVRSNLDFKLNEVPRFWFGGDPFKTRMFDALSLTFPVGERYFIQSVRALRDKINDPELQQKVADFIKQEAQHGIAHDKMNEEMKRQGMPVDQFVKFMTAHFDYILKNRSKQYNIAMTAAAEHLTALMAETFYSQKETLAEVHPFVRALFAWHAIEEMEHRDVAFDVMQQVGEVPENLRKFALAFTTIMMFGFTFYRTNIMLGYDGFSRLERAKMAVRGLPWFFGKQGKLSAMREQYMDWFKADFHPSQHAVIRQYQVWVDTLAATDDPIAAGEAFWQAAV